MTEWEVWLSDGSTRSSRDHKWEDVPDGILIVRWWRGAQKGIHWGDSYYGHPDTWKACSIVEDEVFDMIFNIAQSTTWTPPSERKETNGF